MAPDRLLGRLYRHEAAFPQAGMARDVRLGVMKTRTRRGVPSDRDLGDRLGISDGNAILPLPEPRQTGRKSLTSREFDPGTMP